MLERHFRSAAAGIAVADPGLTRAAITPAAGVTPAAVSRRAISAVRARAATVATADAGELLDALAGDLRVLGEAQADAAAFTVDLHHAD
jgi:hypothetical protein